MMNKIVYFRALLVLFVVAAGQLGYAQQDAEAQALIRQVSQKYAAYKTIQVDFTLQASQTGDSYRNTGTLYMQPAGNRYRIVMAEQEMISDGKSQWIILKEEKEVQVTEADNSGQSISPANIFSFFNKGYKYLSVADEREGGQTLQVVELSPEQPRQSAYFKIKLRITGNQLIHDMTIFDKNGTQYTYAIKNFKANPVLSSDLFVFQKDKYPGLEIVDLR